MDDHQIYQMKEMARQAKDWAYAPYSDFQVGACVKTENGLFAGSNIELSGRMSNHAEEVACIKAVMAGSEELKAVAISTSNQNSVCPCARCLHYLKEFGGEDMNIYMDDGDGWNKTSLKVELPNAYSRGSREGHNNNE